MTQFALTRSWRGASRRELVVSEVEGGHVVALPTIDPSSPLVIWVTDISACVVLGAPSTAGPLGVRGLRSQHGVFEPVLPDGTALGRAPVVADLTTGGAATLALVLDPPSDATIAEGGYRRSLLADVVLCSPEEPDAVGRALEALGVSVDTDADAVAERHFGTPTGAPPQPARQARRSSRWLPWVVAASTSAGVAVGRSDAPQLAAIPYGIGFVAVLAGLATRRSR